MNKVNSDQLLIDSILARDRRALGAFYHKYAPKLTRLIASKVENHADVEEILQDTLYAFLEAIRDFHGEARLQTFLFSICHHKIVDYYRRKKLRQFLFSEMPRLEALVSPILEPEAQLDASTLREKIRAVMSRILPQYRSILELKYMEDLSVTDIAKKLAVTVKSAESQLFRARKAFIELFISI